MVVMALTPEILNTVLWSIPNVLCLIGSASGAEKNGMTAPWVSQVAMSPVLVGASIDSTPVTHRLIAASGAFSVNLWNREDTRTFVKFSKPATYRDGALQRAAGVARGDRLSDIHRGDRLPRLQCEVFDAPRIPHPCSSVRSSTAASRTRARAPQLPGWKTRG